MNGGLTRGRKEGQLFVAECAHRRPFFVVKRLSVLMHGTVAVSACVRGGEGTTS
jgi:hypothetical protein